MRRHTRHHKDDDDFVAVPKIWVKTDFRNLNLKFILQHVQNIGGGVVSIGIKSLPMKAKPFGGAAEHINLTLTLTVALHLYSYYVQLSQYYVLVDARIGQWWQ